MTKECPCGIARVDCEYHRPEEEKFHLADHCVSVDNPLDIEGWGWMGTPSTGRLDCGTVLRRPDGKFRMVTSVNRATREYTTEPFGLHPYALVPKGWREIAASAAWHIPADIPKEDRLQVVIDGRAVGYVDELPLGWTLPED